MSHLFADLTYPQIKRAIARKTILLLPFGQTEEHGTHLPVGADTIIADRVALAVAEAMEAGSSAAKDRVPVLVLPTVPYGYSPQVMTKWPGTFTVRLQVIVDYLSDVCASAARMGFEKMAIITTHGPHIDVARLAARNVFDATGVGVVITQPTAFAAAAFNKVRTSAPGGVCHACEYETSLLMHFGYPVSVKGLSDRDRVKVCNEWVAGDGFRSGKVSWSTWALQNSRSGAYGDPTPAIAATGKACMDAIVGEYCRFLKYFHGHDVPRRMLTTKGTKNTKR